MKIQGKQIERVEIEVDTSTVQKIIIDKIKEAFNIPTQSFINDEGILMEWEELHTSHSWMQDTKVRKATDDDKAAFLVMDKIKELDK